jgi:ATP-dependent helicase HepA
MAFAPGQRWISLAEPEMGLGTVLRVEGRSVQIVFPAPGVVRHYATHAAPLQRAEFRIGDRITGSGRSFVVEQVDRHDGMLRYTGTDGTLLEGELDDIQQMSNADERLIAGRIDRVDRFDFRAEALRRRADAQRSPAWGLMSARIDLITHQLRVAQIAGERRPPRFLLADEVGLGKTIEAGLILARLLASGRAERVLILLPETLVHQWFVELLRRFNLAFAIFDEERCEAIEQAGDGRNPFDDEQLVIADLRFLSANAKRGAQALEAGWDLLVVDEAHHLAWTPENVSADYTLVEHFAHKVPGLILLTATPEQLGRAGHFARLRLLDPARYDNLERYQREAESYVQLSGIVEKLQNAQKLSKPETEHLTTILRGDDEALRALEAMQSSDDADATGVLLNALIDRHGTGRVMFRNRRAVIGGFPRRLPQIAKFDADQLDETQRTRLLGEFFSDVQQPPAPLELDYAGDPRLAWLTDLLEKHADDKFLLICRSQTKVLALEEALRTRSGVKLARFHEAMSIVQRDRNAAYFAEGNGARLLLCSEIGSEGRNFQFAHRLILWDLPLDPDLLEQRIGRLDRIGQKKDIHIHYAAFDGTAQRVMARWYEEGLDAFRQSPADGRELFKRFGMRLIELAAEHAHGAQEPDSEIDALIAETRGAHEELSTLIHTGRDRLLELANLRVPSERLKAALLALDSDESEDDFVLRLFEQFGIDEEDQGQRTTLLDPAHLSTDGFPGLQDGPQIVTFNRAVALAREDLPFLRADHPMITGALDLLLQSEQGSAAFVVDSALPARTVLLECVFVLEATAPRKLAADRFLPALPLRVVVDTKLQERVDFNVSEAASKRAVERPVDLTRYRKILLQLVPPMRKAADDIARKRAVIEIERALNEAAHELDAESMRLYALRRVNPAVREEEIQAIADELASLRKHLPLARPRLDAVRLICSADFLSMR